MRGGGLRAYALLYLLFLYAPILLLPIFAFNSGTIIAFPLQGLSNDIATSPCLFSIVFTAS